MTDGFFPWSFRSKLQAAATHVPALSEMWPLLLGKPQHLKIADAGVDLFCKHKECELQIARELPHAGQMLPVTKKKFEHVWQSV